MSAFDTFFLLFRTDADKAKAEIEQLDQKIEKLKETGKKRSAQENKDLKESIARQKELTGVLKESQSAGSKLVESLGAAAAAAVSFGAIRSGITNVSEFNAGLAVQSKLLGQNAKDLEIMSHAAKLAGGSSEGALANLSSIGRLLLNTPNGGGDAKDWLKNVSADLDKKAGNDMIARRRVLQNQYPMITDAGLQSMVLDPAELGRLMGESSRQINDKNSDYSRDRRIQENVSSIEKNVSGIFDKINRLLPESVSAAGQSSVGGAIGTILGAAFGLKYGGAILRGGARVVGGAAAGAGTVTGGALAVGGAAVYGLGDAAMNPDDNVLKSLGNKGWRWFRKNYPAYYPQDAAKKGMDDMSFWQSQGYTREQSAAIVGNMMAESGGKANARGDGGRAHGLFQHHPDRRERIFKNTGIDISTATHEQQREAAAWEMRNGVNGFKDSQFRSQKDAASATRYFGRYYEGFLGSEDGYGAEMMRRVGYASNALGGGARGGQSSTVQIDKIDVHTQATDAKGISNAIGQELSTTLRRVTNHFDDGEKY